VMLCSGLCCCALWCCAMRFGGRGKGRGKRKRKGECAAVLRAELVLACEQRLNGNVEGGGQRGIGEGEEGKGEGGKGKGKVGRGMGVSPSLSL